VNIKVEDMVDWLLIRRMVIIATHLNVSTSCSLGPRLSPPKTRGKREPGNIQQKTSAPDYWRKCAVWYWEM